MVRTGGRATTTTHGKSRAAVTALVVAFISGCPTRVQPEDSDSRVDATVADRFAAPDTCSFPDRPDVDFGDAVMRPPPGACVLSNGRDCREGCLCDDACNLCTCYPINGQWEVRGNAMLCSFPRSGITCEGPGDPACMRVPRGDISCTADPALSHAYYCPPSCSGSCPAPTCRLAIAGFLRDAFWCCP